MLWIKQKLVEIPNWWEADQLAIYKRVEELYLGPPNTNPSTGREEDFNSES